jgi:hypothetical protein
VFFFSGMMHPGFLVASFYVDVGGVGVSIGSAVLSHWVDDACDLKEADDPTT